MSEVFVARVPPRAARRWRRRIPLLLTVVLGVAASLALFANIRGRERERLAIDLERGMHGLISLSESPLIAGFSRRLDRRLEVAAEHLGSLPEVDQQALDAHRSTFRWSRSPAFFVNFEYLPRVDAARREQLEADPASGLRILDRVADGSPVTAARRSEHFPVLFETSAVATQALRGVDRAAEPLARLAMEQARDSGRRATFSRIPLGGGAAHDMVFHDFRPIYEGGATPDLVADRRRLLVGFVSAVSYTSLDELGFLMPSSGIQGIEAASFTDLGQLDPAILGPALALAHRRGTLAQVAFERADRPVRMIGVATPEFVAAHHTAESWTALALGLLTTGLASSLVYRAGRRSEEVIRLVEERTSELNERTRALSAANRRLLAENEERQRAEAALRESETRYRLLAQNLSDVIYTHDLDFVCTYISPSIVQQRGFEVDEIVGRNILENLTPESADFARKQLGFVLRAIEKNPELARGHRTTQFEAVCKDGSTITLENRTSLLFDDDRRIIGVLGVSRDISDRRQVEKEKEELESRYRHAQKMEAIGRLAGGVAHDFNNLLTGILGYTDVLKLELDEGTRAARSVRVIERAASRAQQLTSQLLGFARRGKLQSVPVHVDEAIGDVISFLEHTLHKNIQVAQSVAQEAPWVKGDPTQIHQLLLNLAVNARDAMPGGGSLRFSTELVELDRDAVRAHVGLSPGRYVRITVADTGIGIPADKLERVFEPFFTDKEDGSGTGMGLAMVYGVAKSHQGSVTVRSEKGRGSVFEVHLPYAPDPLQRAARRQDELVRGSGTILVVDDEPIIRELARELLGRLGYRVLTADDGAQAIDTYRDHAGEIDLVIIDVMMPRMGGRECLQRLREIDSGVRAIFATAYSSDDIEPRSNEGEAAGFLQKPYRMQQLSESVARVLGGARDASPPSVH